METSNGVDDIRKHVRIYLAVFGGLAALTIVTVAIASVHLAIPLAVMVALIIAMVKSSMVASFFMHLISEKKVIYLALLITAVFFLGLMFLPLLGYIDRVRY